MCFKKPKAPEKSEEEKRAEEELAALRKQRQDQLNLEVGRLKDDETEAEIARQSGFRGNRSLIQGAKGGAGFMGKGSRKKQKHTPRQRTGPTGPAIMGGFSGFSGFTGSLLGGFGTSSTGSFGTTSDGTSNERIQY
jgi:hypothetical protein